MAEAPVRFEISNEGGVTSGPVAYELQVAETATCSSGAYTTVPTAATGHWQVIDSTFLTDGEATFNISPGLTDEATTFVAGQLKDAGNTTGSITLDPDQFAELEFSVQATTNATNGGDYCFRLYDATNNQVLDTYSVYAEVSLIGDDLTQAHYRWRNDDGGEVGVNSPFQVSETLDDTTGSASDVLLSGMTITPGAGDYLVWFSGSLEDSSASSTQYVSLYVNGAQLPHTERQVVTEGSIPATSFPVATHALVTGVLAGQAIDVRWRTTAPTATMHERTLVVTPINPANSTEVSGTPDDTTGSASDVLVSGMSITPGAGDYHVWFSSSVEGSTAPSTQNVSLYVNGVQIPHTERQIFTETSIPDTSFPVALHARVTGVLAGQAIDVRWRTTLPTATMHERTLLVSQINPADTTEVSATVDDTTTSISDVLAGGMTITPGAGDYLVWFSGSVEGSSGDSRQHVSLYVNGAQFPHTDRQIWTGGSIPDTSFPVATHAYVPGVLAGQAIDVRWRTTAGTATMHERTLVVEKLSGASGATFAAVEDTKLTGLAKNTIKRVRLEVSNEGGLTSGPVAYELQVAETATCSAGTYTTVPTDTSGHWQVTDSTFITDGEPTSNIFPGLTDEATTFVAGELRDAANTTGSITLNPDELTELEFSVQATTNATDGGDYCFRLYDATNARLLDTYTVYAEVSLAGSVVSLDLADHAFSQTGDKLTTTSPVTDMLFRFKLTRSGTVTVDNLRVNFTTGGGVANGDVSAGELWRDNNNDGAIDGGDTLIQGTVTPSAGVLTFTTDFSPALAGTDYLVQATVGNLVGGNTTTFSMGITDIDELEVVTETGAASNVTHIQDSAGVIYYSVGTNAADLKNGSPTLTLSGGTATLTVAQPNTIGVGDEITYNGSTKAYISGRLGPTVYTVTTATAGIPTDVAGATVNSILRAFNDLDTATSGSADVNHLNTSDLVVGGFQLNWACYNDGPDPSIAVRIEEPWITGPSNFIRVFTPTDPTQVGTTQRHNGTAGTGYRIVPTTSTPPGGGWFDFLLVTLDTGYVRIEGIEIDGSGVTNAENIRGIMVNDTIAQDDVRLSHNLIHDIANSTIDDTDESDVWGILLDQTSNSKVSNNIVYNIFNNSTNGASNPDGIEVQNIASTFYAYNNTFYNIQNNGSTGIARGINDGASKLVVRNNYVGLVGGLGGGICFNPPFAAENNNVSSDATAAGAGSQINQSAYASYFVSTTGGSENLHLVNDSFTLWGSFGADLDSDPNLPVTDDIDLGVRDAATPDVGADEFGAGGMSLTLADHDVSQIGDQFTTTPSVTAALFRFHLTRTGTVTVDNLRVNFTTAGGIANGDMSVGELWVDNNDDGAIDGGDTLIQGSLTSTGGVFTFTTDFSPALTGTNYLVRATVGNLAAGDTTTFSLGTADVDEVEGGVSELGSITNAVHTQDAGGVIYYSVGTNAADLKSGTPTVTIASGWATFTVSQPDTIGVGDEITYNGATKAYISSRASSTVYSVITAIGQTPPDVAGATVNSILRAFNTLTAATTGSADVNHLNTSDLVAGGFQLNWSCYNDGPDPSSHVQIEEPWVTGPSNFIRVFTPVNPTQVGVSQRHNGTAGTGYRIVPTESTPVDFYSLIFVGNDNGYVRIEGIELDGSNVTNGENIRGIGVDDASAMDDVRISHCLVHDITNSTVDDADVSDLWGIQLRNVDNSKVSNNIIYNLTNLSTFAGSNPKGFEGSASGMTYYLYNNTIYNIKNSGSTDSASGVDDDPGAIVIATNNYVGLVDSTLGTEECFEPTITQSNNVSSDATAAGPGSQINQSAYASYFVSTTPGSENLHLLNDSFTLWGSFGSDLDSDPNLPVTDDIDGGVRDASTPDVGADEFGAGGTSLTLADHDVSQIGDQFTTTSSVTAALFRFHLTRTGTVTVDNLRVSFTTAGGIANGDVSVGELWVDNNNDGAIDGGDTLIQGSVTPSGGVFTFTTDFSPALVGTNYLVRATVDNLAAGDTTTFSVGTADIDEVEGGVSESGSITNAVHTQDPGGVIYYSVGTNAADLKNGTPTVTIASGWATFTVAQPLNVGVGDEITYNGATKAYISGRTSSTVYSVITAIGQTPPDVAGVTVNSILRAFNTLTAATTGSADVDHLNTSDLVAGGFQLNWAGYNDGPDPSSAVRIEEPWVTGPSNFIRLFTPTDTTQVGTSQRHNGTAGSGYRIASTEASPPLGSYNLVRVSNDAGYVRIEGIEIDGSNVTNAEAVRGIQVDDTGSAMEDVRISYCLIHDITNSTIDDTDASVVRGIRLDLTNNSKVSNNIIYNITNVSTNAGSNVRGILAATAGKTHYIYNNTVYNVRQTVSTGSARGIYDNGGSTALVRNNYVGLVDSALGAEAAFAGTFAAENNNVSFDASAAGAGSQINQAAYASYFVSTTPGSEDLHLLSDSFTLWGSFGADLDSDPNLPVTDDIDGGVRDAVTPDIGADEFGAGPVSLTLADHDAGQVGDQFTTTSSITAALFRFHLIRTGIVTVDNLRVNFTTAGGIANGDMSVGELWVDNNDDGAIDGGDTLIQGSLTPTGGVFTFTTDFSPALTGTNYLVRATVDNLAAGDTTTFSVGTADIDEVEGGVSELGSITNAVHTQDAGGVIYYSVGTNAADLKNGTPTVTIASGWATFTIAQPLNVGVGDEITYNGATKAYISSRTSSTVYSVITAIGQTPPDVAGATVNSILRAFNTLTAATTGSADVNHLNTADLVAGGFQLNWAGYNDGPDPSSHVQIEEPWVTGPSNFIRVFTPVDPAQVGVSQRHNGTAGTGYRIVPTESAPVNFYSLIFVSTDNGYVRIEGIELDGSSVTNGGNIRGIGVDDSSGVMEDVRISHCLIHNITNSTADDVDVSDLWGIHLSRVDNSKTSNNVIYNLTNLSAHVDSNPKGFEGALSGNTYYAYNNTIYNVKNTGSTASAKGFADNVGVTTIATNNYVGLVDSTLGTEECFVAGITQSNNVSSDATAAGAGSQINQSSYASYFVSTTPGSEDLHLLNDSFTLWGSFGADLDSDPNLPVTDDIDGGARDATTPDIGADEFGAPLSLILGDHDVGQIGDQFTTTSSVTAALFRFHLTRTGTVTVDNLRVSFTTGGGIANGDLSNGELWVDNNNDGAVDGGDTLIQGSLTPSGGVFTFTTDFSPALAGTNYLVRVTVDNLAAGDTTTFSVGTADIDEVEGGVSESGSITNAVHTQDPGGVIYYSVGTNAADLKSGTPTVTISSGWASFTVAQPLNVGVGDEITYNGATKAYISSRASSTVYSVITATGQTPPDIAGATVNSILRAFNTLTAATTGSADVNHLNTSDLVAGGFQLNWSCYNDGPDPSSQVVIEEPWVTGPSNLIRVFTPTDTTQVGTTQRHNGTAGSGYRIAPTERMSRN